MKKWIVKMWKRITGKEKQEQIDVYRDALSRIGFIIVDNMNSRKFRRLLQRNPLMYRMIVHEMQKANMKIEDNE